MHKATNFRRKTTKVGSRSLGKPSQAGPTTGDAKLSYERFLALAQSAASAGDYVEAENFYQHAEHYLRLLQNDVEQSSRG